MSIVSKKINLHKNNCMSCMQVLCLLFVFVIPETGRLSRIMVNTALEYIRKDGEINRVLTLNEVPDIIDPESEDEDLEKIPQTVLMKFVSELPSGYRTVFNLYTFEEKSHKEIAALLGINEKSSSSQLFRARAILAKRIKMYLTKASV